MYAIANGKEGPPRPEGISEDARSFLDQCLQYDPAHRPTATELLEHPWVSVESSGVPALEGEKAQASGAAALALLKPDRSEPV
jgi:serine/threonine protein kinase